MIVGFGCAMALAVQTIQNLLVNFTMIPNMSGYLPLISIGGMSGIVTYILLGLVLSIYRYKNILPGENQMAVLRGKAE